jgi:hypothetical protein
MPQSGNPVVYTDLDYDIFLGDFNGDGCDDFFAIDPSTMEYKLVFFAGKQYFSEITGSLMPTAYNYKIIKVGDYNGNGKDDLLAVDKYNSGNSIKVFEYSNALGENEISYNSFGLGNHLTLDHELIQGDFNGDGNIDLLSYYNNNWELMISNGKKFIMKEDFNPGFRSFIYLNPEDYSITVRDFNGDGKSDIIETSVIYYLNETEIRVFYSNGNQFNSNSQVVTHNVLGQIHVESCTFGDFSGDGSTDIFSEGYDEPSPLFLLSIPVKQKDMVIKIANGFGVQTDITYKPLTDPDNLIYEKGNSSEYPLTDIQAPLYVVSSVIPDEDFGQNIQTEYFYKGAKVHKEGKGFLGFEQVNVTNNRNNLLTETHYDLYKETIESKEYYFHPYPVLVEQYSLKEGAKDNKLLERTTDMDIKKPVSNNNFIYYPVSTISFTRAWENDDNHTYKGASKTVQNKNDVDEYGNSKK